MVCGHIQASRGKGSWGTCPSPSCLPRSCPQIDGTFIKGTFIMLHTWANAVMALTYHPELTSSHSGVETPLTQNIDRSIRLSLSCSRAVSECMIYADLFQTTSYVRSSPCSRVCLTALMWLGTAGNPGMRATYFYRKASEHMNTPLQFFF